MFHFYLYYIVLFELCDLKVTRHRIDEGLATQYHQEDEKKEKPVTQPSGLQLRTSANK